MPFLIFNYVFFGILALLMFYPLWHTFVGSLLTRQQFYAPGFHLWPKEGTLATYRFIIATQRLRDPYRVTVFITVVGTALNLTLTTLAAYALSKKYPGSSFIMFSLVITMFVQVGLIPNFVLFRKMGITNTMWVYFVPSFINVFYLVIMRTWFRAFPQELEDCAIVEGAGKMTILFRIVLPLSMPVIATIGLFYAIAKWETLFASLFYMYSKIELQTLQHYMFTLVTTAGHIERGIDVDSEFEVLDANIKLACIMLTVAPILIVYPFIQKYFVKGMMIGAIKG